MGAIEVRSVTLNGAEKRLTVTKGGLIKIKEKGNYYPRLTVVKKIIRSEVSKGMNILEIFYDRNNKEDSLKLYFHKRRDGTYRLTKFSRKMAQRIS